MICHVDQRTSRTFGRVIGDVKGMLIVQLNEFGLWVGTAILVLILCLPVGAPVRAQEGAETGHEAGAPDAYHARFAVAAFVGATRVHGSNESTLGFEGGFNISDSWSVGGVVERADRERSSTLLLVGLGWHPLGPAWRFQIGLGRKDPAGEYETVVRAGVAYEKELHNRWFLKPYFAVDFIQHEDEEQVVGVYFGRGF